MRFFCEWCHERVDIKDAALPRADVLAHFVTCHRRPEFITGKQIEGLATHIAGLVGDNFEFVLEIRKALAG